MPRLNVKRAAHVARHNDSDRARRGYCATRTHGRAPARLGHARPVEPVNHHQLELGEDTDGAPSFDIASKGANSPYSV